MNSGFKLKAIILEKGGITHPIISEWNDPRWKSLLKIMPGLPVHSVVRIVGYTPPAKVQDVLEKE